MADEELSTTSLKFSEQDTIVLLPEEREYSGAVGEQKLSHARARAAMMTNRDGTPKNNLIAHISLARFCGRFQNDTNIVRNSRHANRQPPALAGDITIYTSGNFASLHGEYRTCELQDPVWRPRNRSA